MTFKVPSFGQYLGSLILATLFSVLAYFILLSQGVTDIAYSLAVGLIIGHLLGAFSARRDGTETPAAGTDEIISLYVGNLAYRVQREDLQKLFSEYGEVHSVRIMTDRNTRKPRGYGFVEMDRRAAEQAISKLDNTECFGRTLRVSTAKQRLED